MEWRCDWCGKPHEEDDPPCDNCGHGKFEKAVVPRTDLADEGEREATLVWVCTDCGREHPKHAPPCSRCGNTTLEKERQHVDESELNAPGYLDLMTPRYLATLGLTLLVATVLILGFVGVIPLPGFDQGGVPDVDGVPGNESAAGGLDLADVEAAYLTALNEQRGDADEQQFERSESLDEITTFYHQEVVKWRFAGGPQPDGETAVELLVEECRTDTGTGIDFTDVSVSLDSDESATELGEALATEMVESAGFEPGGANAIGVDAHAVDGELSLGQFTCER